MFCLASLQTAKAYDATLSLGNLCEYVGKIQTDDSGGTNVCTGVNAGSLTLSGHTGSVLNWESSTDGGTTWISIGNTTTTQSYFIPV